MGAFGIYFFVNSDLSIDNNGQGGLIIIDDHSGMILFDSK